MTATTLDTLIATHGSLLALSRHLLGDEWSRGRYQTLAAQVAAGELTGWVAACVAAHAELEELRAAVAAMSEKTGSAAAKIRAILAATGTTQTALAAAYGCRDGAMSQFLSGKRPIPDLPRMVRALSEVTGGIVHVEVEILARDGELRHNETLVTQYEPEETDETK